MRYAIAQLALGLSANALIARNAPEKICEAKLNGDYNFPALIVPVNSDAPNTAYGNSFYGKVNHTTCSIFNFEIPKSAASKTCSPVFLYPEQKDPDTTVFQTSGCGSVAFKRLKGPANKDTTFANIPAVDKHLGSWDLVPGTSLAISGESCVPGTTVTIEMCSSEDFALNYLQKLDPMPIGLYMRFC